MPVIDGRKMACQPCIRGHRVGSCNHAGERQMVPVKKPGRPLATCPHLPGTQCDCRFQTIATISSSSAAASTPSNADNSNTTTLDYATALSARTTAPHWAGTPQSADYSSQTYLPTSPATNLPLFSASQPVLWTGSGPLLHNNSFPEDMFLAGTPMTGHDSFTGQYPLDVASQNEYTVSQPQGYWWWAPEGSTSYISEMELGADQSGTFPQTWDDPSLDEDGGSSSRDGGQTGKKDGV